MKSRILLLVSVVALVGAGLLWAQTPPPSGTAPMPGMAMEGHTSGKGGPKMEDCKAMMAKRQAMREQMDALDAKLGALVATMDAATGSARIDAMAAVLDELVAQRKAMREATESMQPMMMDHMMKHMQAGEAGGMKSMGGCPMMGGSKPAEGGHEGHR